ncbi:HET-domain-containing protein [Annulohypoxylon nitens]|nr:HET-domain-containing protein [Annulohypoxylon nitens]
MLCDICRTTLQNYLSDNNYYYNGLPQGFCYPPYSFKDSALKGCFICKKILEHITTRVEKGDENVKLSLFATVKFDDSTTDDDNLSSHHVIDITNDLFPTQQNYVRLIDDRVMEGHGIFSYSIYIGSTSVPPINARFRFIFHTVHHDPSVPEFTTRSTSTADVIDLWRHWFHTCSQSHTSCREQELGLQPFLPCRLIEILGSSDTLYWRLVCGSDIKNANYITLSHCWGESEHTRLMRDKIACFGGKQLVSDLPKTYRDAMKVALSLDVRYIWIDSLCIIQDNQNDWKIQSSLMGLIYQSACCNIAAAWGTDGTAGCFSDRHTIVDTSIKVTAKRDVRTKEYMVYDPDTYISNITNAPLNGRGWVVQERYLARKQLSFTRNQVYWECPELSASDEFPGGIPEEMEGLYQKRVISTKPGPNQIEEPELRVLWTRLVESYSNCDLTKLSGKSVALAGLAGYIKTTMGDIYLAGLWKKDLEYQLLWERRSSQRFSSKSASYIAPTWSWMSINGSIRYDDNYLSEHVYPYSPLEYIPYLVKIVEVSVEAFDTMHSFRSATLTLRGIAIQAAVISARLEDTDTGFCVTKCKLRLVKYIRNTRGFLTRRVAVLISWDNNVAIEQDLLFMFVSRPEGPQQRMDGLVLERLPGDEQKYRRLGIFNTTIYGERWPHLDIDRVIRHRWGLKFAFREYCYGLHCHGPEHINLDDERLKDLVYTATVI